MQLVLFFVHLFQRPSELQPSTMEQTKMALAWASTKTSARCLAMIRSSGFCLSFPGKNLSQWVGSIWLTRWSTADRHRCSPLFHGGFCRFQAIFPQKEVMTVFHNTGNIGFITHAGCISSLSPRGLFPEGCGCQCHLMRNCLRLMLSMRPEATHSYSLPQNKSTLCIELSFPT